MECYGDLPKSPYRYSDDNAVKERFQGLASIAKAGAFLIYHHNEMTQKMLYEIKYNQNTHLAVHLGTLAAQDIADELREIDSILPIPLHPAKQRIRGYNQSEYFGMGLGEQMNVPVDVRAMQRTKNTVSQTSLHRDERFRNVENVFEVTDPSKVLGKHILLIDDVITTGATLVSAAKSISAHRPKSINILTLASAFEL